MALFQTGSHPEKDKAAPGCNDWSKVVQCPSWLYKLLANTFRTSSINAIKKTIYASVSSVIRG